MQKKDEWLTAFTRTGIVKSNAVGQCRELTFLYARSHD